MYVDSYIWPGPGGEKFDAARPAFSTTPGQNGWTQIVTTTAGAPAFVINDGGGTTGSLASNVEVENLCLAQNDKLIFDVAEIHSLSFWVSLTGMGAASSLAFGLASARNNVLDSVAANAWFRLDGATPDIKIESDDGATDLDDKVTGQQLLTVTRKLTIDFASRGKNDIRFFVDANPVALNNTFTLAGYTGKLQPLIQLQKTAAADAPAFTIEAVEAVLARTF